MMSTSDLWIWIWCLFSCRSRSNTAMMSMAASVCHARVICVYAGCVLCLGPEYRLDLSLIESIIHRTPVTSTFFSQFWSEWNWFSDATDQSKIHKSLSFSLSLLQSPNQTQSFPSSCWLDLFHLLCISLRHVGSSTAPLSANLSESIKCPRRPLVLLFTPIALHLLYTPIAATWTVLTSSTTAPRSVADAVRRVLSLGHRHVDLLCCVMVNQLIRCDKMKPKQNILHQSCR